MSRGKYYLRLVKKHKKIRKVVKPAMLTMICIHSLGVFQRLKN